MTEKPGSHSKDGHLPEPRHVSDLNAVFETVLAMLADGVADRTAPANRPALATVGTDGLPQVRTVVLRAFDPASRTLMIHVDIRSGKIQELAAQPQAALHVYDPAREAQFRLACHVKVHRAGAVHERAWADKPHLSRVHYTVAATPGQPIAGPGDAEIAGGSGDAGKENFAVLELEIQGIEWLYIGSRGHRRARFQWDGNAWEGTWLVP